MKAAYVTTSNPYDIHSWSGLTYYIFQALKMAEIQVESIGNLKESLEFFFNIKSLFDHSPELSQKQQKLEMSRDQFLEWKRQIASHQQATRENHPQQSTLFDTGVNQFDPQGIDPFALTQYATRFYDLPQMRLSEEGDPCIYFLLDNASHLILYIGETIHSNKRWKGGHHCEDYLKKYVQLNRKHGLEVLPAIAFEWGTPEETRLREKMEFTLIKKWLPPFNKENWKHWGQPFGA